MTSGNPTPAQASIRHANACFVHAFHAHNAQEIARRYAPSGRLLPAHSTMITGRLAICAFWQGVLDMGLCCTERTALEIQSAASMGHEIGTYVLRLENGQQVDSGLYIALWQWTEGRWQIHCDVWRSSQLGLTDV